MSNTQEEWTTKEDSAAGLFVKIAPDGEARMRFVGKPIKKMEQFGDQAPRIRYYSRVIFRTMADGKVHSEAKIFGFGTMIKNAIADLANDEDWGDPEGYDIIIKRTGADLQTKYSLIAKPKTELKKELHAEAMAIDLDAATTKDGGGAVGGPAGATGAEYDPFQDE